MPSFGNNPALTLYRNLQVEKGEDTDVKATRGFLARGQADKGKKRNGCAAAICTCSKTHVYNQKKKR